MKVLGWALVSAFLVAGVVGLQAPAPNDAAVVEKASDDAAKKAAAEAEEQGASESEAKEAATEAAENVKQEAAQENKAAQEGAMGAGESGADASGPVPAAALLGASGLSGDSGDAIDLGMGFVDVNATHRAEGYIILAGYKADGFKPYVLTLRTLLAAAGKSANVSIDDIMVSDLKDAELPRGRRLLGGEFVGMDSCGCKFTLVADTA